MDDFEALKEQARRSYRECCENTDLCKRSVLATRHSADQAQGAKAHIEELLTQAPEAELPAVRKAYAATVRSCESAERSYLDAVSAYEAAVASRDEARAVFKKTFGEEP